MIRLKIAFLVAIVSLPIPAAAQERVAIGTQRLTHNGALFLAAARGAATVEPSVYFIKPQAVLDVADIGRQIAWYKGQGRVDKNVSARDVVDPSFVK